MAKARDIPGLTTDLPYGEVAARVLEVRVDELMEHSVNVLDMGEIEGVHSMRVATRRLRAAIEIFWPCFPKEDEKRVLKKVKALADALGERRDRDVAIEAVDAFAAAMPAPDRPGIQSLIERYGAEQRQANVELEPFVDPARLRVIHDEVLALAAAAREGIAEELEELELDRSDADPAAHDETPASGEEPVAALGGVPAGETDEEPPAVAGEEPGEAGEEPPAEAAGPGERPAAPPFEVAKEPPTSPNPPPAAAVDAPHSNGDGA